MGAMSIRRALALSRNIPALKAFQQVDNKKIIEFVQKLGIEPEIENGKIHEAHSLGSFTGVNSMQMAAAYAAFSNGGYYNEPYSVSKVVFRDTGEEKKHEEKKVQAMSDATAYMITSILDDVSITTGGSMPNIAMKTGTTNFPESYRRKLGMADDAIRDSWVIGYTTKTVIGMWYGYKETTQESVSQGYYCHNIAGTLQRDKLFTALAKEIFEKDKEEFKMPNSVVRLPIVAGSNPAKIAGNGYAGAVVYEYFKKGAEPNSTQTEENLAAPGNLKVNYNESNNTVSLLWDAVTPTTTDASYGTFGYNVYFNNTLLGFTSQTNYTINQPTTPYGTYKVIATYKSYDGIQSAAATYELKKISKTLKVQQVEKIEKESFNLSEITNYFKVTEDGENVTDKTSNWTAASIKNSSGENIPLTTKTLTTPGTYKLIYHFTYNGETKSTQEITITIIAKDPIDNPDDNQTTPSN